MTTRRSLYSRSRACNFYALSRRLVLDSGLARATVYTLLFIPVVEINNIWLGRLNPGRVSNFVGKNNTKWYKNNIYIIIPNNTKNNTI